MEKEIIKLKGTGDGIKMYLDKDAPFSDILNAVSDRLKAWRNFFGTGHCHMYFVGRKLNKSDMLRLEAVVKALLPESTVIYGERGIADTVQLPKQFLEEINKRSEDLPKDGESGDKDKDGDTVENNDVPSVSTDDDTREIEEMERVKEVITTNYKSSRARLYEGVVRSGRVVESDGHLVLVGDVEEGGTVIANGNVIILGTLSGSAQAGCMGNVRSYVAAMVMQPTDLRIAHINKKYYRDEVKEKPQKAFISGDEILMVDFFETEE